MKPIIYLDMDGVICDFTKEYFSIDFKGSDHEKFRYAVLEHRIFEKLEWEQNGKLLAGVLMVMSEQWGVQLEILSSLGSQRTDMKAAGAEQKTKWLESRGMGHIKRNFVTRFVHKADYAHEFAIMIDDREDVIDTFTAAGGHGILYKSDDWMQNALSIGNAVKKVVGNYKEQYADVHI